MAEMEATPSSARNHPVGYGILPVGPATPRSIEHHPPPNRGREEDEGWRRNLRYELNHLLDVALRAAFRPATRRLGGRRG
jgi:hypothetical protein